MRSSHSLDRLETAFDDDRLVANAGLLLPATLAQHLGLQQLVDAHLDLGAAPGRANVGDKLLTLIASALAGGDCIDDADALRAGGTASVLGCAVKAPSTLGTFLRSFRWGHVRQLDRVTRELLARAWATGAGPGAAPFTIDLDSTICETYGLAKEGARHHGYTGVRGYHPPLAVAAGSGDVLMARLREGRAHTARGAAHFLRETIGRVRAAGASGQLTMRADSGFYAHAVVAVCRKLGVRFSITIRQQPSMRRLIEAIPEAGWTPIEYWLAGGADVAETTYTPFKGEQDAASVRLIVRRVKPTPGSQLALFTRYSYHAFITDRAGQTLELEADHRRHAEIENAIRDLKYGVGLNHLPSGRLLAGRPGSGWPRGSSRPRRSGGGSSLSPGGSLALLVSSRSICRRAGPGPSTSPPPSPGCGRSRSRPDAARPRRPLHCLAPACLRAPPHRRLLLSARPDSNRRTLPAPPTAPAPPKTTVSRSTARANQTVGGFGIRRSWWNGRVRGAGSTTSSTRRWSGSTGSTTAASSARSTTCRLPSTRRTFTVGPSRRRPGLNERSL